MSERELALADIEMSQRPAVSRPQGLDRLPIAAEDELANAQSHGRSRRSVFASLQLGNAIPHYTELLIILRDRLHEQCDFARAKRIVGENNVANGRRWRAC